MLISRLPALAPALLAPLRYLSDVTSFRSRTLDTFMEDFQDDPHSALPHLQFFLTTPPSAVATGFDVKRFEVGARECERA